MKKYINAFIHYFIHIHTRLLEEKFNFKYILPVLFIHFCMVLIFSYTKQKELFYTLYFIFLYYFIRKAFIKLRNQYRTLKENIHEIATGNFITIDDDLGVFNPLKEDLNNVKEGFETAIKNELKSSQMRTELITNVSHDLKTPLTCIENYITLLQDDAAHSDKYLKELNHYTDRLTSLIEDLFEISKIESGNIQIEKTNLDIISLINQSLVETQELLDGKHLEVIKNYSHHHINVHLDGEKTYRVLENLLVNISKYALNNSRVYIDVIKEEKVKIIFKNISEERIEYTGSEITEKLVRGDKSRHKEGSGLGLAIAKSLVEIQGGQFKVVIDGDLFKAIIILP